MATADQPRRVVVGVDGSDPSRHALQRAALEAAAHSAVLEVIHAWSFLDQPGPEFDPHYGESSASQRIQRFIVETLGSVPPDVAVTLVNDHPLPALLDGARGAFTLVVGARGISGFKGLVLGSVSQHAVLHAPCSILVVNAPGHSHP